MRALLTALVMTLGVARFVAAADIVVPDDYPTIQSAVDAANQSDHVLVRPGDYPESVRVIGKQLWIEGLGGVPVIRPPSVKNPGFYQRDMSTSCHRLFLYSIAVVGGGVAADCNDCNFDSVVIDGSQEGIRLRPCGGPAPTVFNTRISNIVKGYGVTVGKPSHVDIVGNVIEGCGKDGIHIKGPYNSRIEGNIVRGCRRNGIVLKYSYASAFDNVAENNGKSGFVAFVPGPESLEGNAASNNGTYGFYLRAEQQPSAFSAVNTAAGNGKANFRTRAGAE